MTPLRNLMNLRTHHMLPALVLLFCLVGANLVHAQPRYSYSTDGSEVTDAQTGLIWRRCSQGQTWSGSSCDGMPILSTHAQALAAAATQGGWRLPNVKELSSLVDASRIGPSIDPTAFPGTPSYLFWSSSPSADISNAAWLVNFNNGGVGRNSRSSTYDVRLVR